MTSLTSVTISQLAVGICLHFRIPYNMDHRIGTCGTPGDFCLYPRLTEKLTYPSAPDAALTSAACRALGGRG